MSKVIRVSDATFERLKRHAEPLVDNPSTVIERLLDHYEGAAGEGAAENRPRPLAESLPPSAGPSSPPDMWHEDRTRSGALSDAFLRRVLLLTLHELGGAGATSDVVARMGTTLANRGLLTEADRELNTKSNPWQRWETNTRFARKHLVEEGLLASESARGTWELSESGKREAERLLALGASDGG